MNAADSSDRTVRGKLYRRPPQGTTQGNRYLSTVEFGGAGELRVARCT
jgi:hypothetical protein